MTPSPSPASSLLASAAVLALLGVALVVLSYLLACAVWPYRLCRRCHGTSRLVTRRGRARYCPRCRGTGLRLRLGRRVYNRVARFRHARRADRLRAFDQDRWGGGDRWNGNY